MQPSKIKVGDRFGNLVVKEENGRDKRKLRLWKCDCDCGNEYTVNSNKLNTGHTQSCGCKKRPVNYAKYTNKRYGKLFVTTYSHRTITGKYYNFICDCGHTGVIASTNLSQTVSCIKCRERYHKYYEEISGTYWKRLEHNAKNRGFTVEVTQEFIWNLFLAQNRKCAITGWDLVFDKGNKQTASLDRIDASKGYTEDNVQWVHKDINRLKNNFNEEWLLKVCKDIVMYKKLLEDTKE